MVEPVLGTRAEVHVAAATTDVADAAERAVLDQVARLEQVFSVFDDESELWKFRRTGSTTSPELQTVVRLADQWRLRTEGAFHPGVHRLHRLWQAAEAKGVIPAQSDVDRLVDDLGPGTADLDLNAMAKGWIADRAVSDIAASTDVDAAWLSLGGDVVHRGNEMVVVGIEDPHRPYDNVAPLAAITIENEALATSGGARRWWTIDGKRYPKIIDPRSGRPSAQLASATVVAPTGEAADVLATVAMVMSPDESLRLIAEVGAECFFVHHDRSVTKSSGRFTLD